MTHLVQDATIKDIEADLDKILIRLTETREPVAIVQDGKTIAVLQDMKSFEETRQTLALLKKLAIGNTDVAAGRVTPAKDVIARLRSRAGRRES